MEPALTPDAMVLDGEQGIHTGQTTRLQEMLRKLATIDEDLVEDQAGGQAQSGRGA